MRLVHTGLSKKLALQRTDGGPEPAYHLSFRALYGLRWQNCTEKLVASLSVRQSTNLPSL